jgi:hypothetical protein
MAYELEFKASTVSQRSKNIAAKGIKAPASPTMTVIVCTYNRYRYLAQLVAKFEVQNVRFSFEIVIVDNSDDEAAKTEFSVRFNCLRWQGCCRHPLPARRTLAMSGYKRRGGNILRLSTMTPSRALAG